MMPIRYAVNLLNKMGNNIEYRQYVRPESGRLRYYITSINGKLFKTNEQTEARKEIDKLMEVAGLND